MPAGKSLMEAIMAESGSEEISALSLLFNTKNYQQLKMLSEISPSNMYVSVILGVLQRRYKSKVLKLFDEEMLSRQKSRDRQGIVEFVEVLLGVRRYGEESREGRE